MVEKKTSEPSAPVPEFPRRPSSAGGSVWGYAVEARYGGAAKQFGHLILGRDWQKVDFTHAPPPTGVPISSPHESGDLGACGLLGYQAAQALRWWFMANIEAQTGFLGSYGVETRLIKYSIKYSREWTAVSAHEAVGGSGPSGRRPPDSTEAGRTMLEGEG